MAVIQGDPMPPGVHESAGRPATSSTPPWLRRSSPPPTRPDRPHESRSVNSPIERGTVMAMIAEGLTEAEAPETTNQVRGRYLYAIIEGGEDGAKLGLTGLDGGGSTRWATARSPPWSATFPTARSAPSVGSWPPTTKSSNASWPTGRSCRWPSA